MLGRHDEALEHLQHALRDATGDDGAERVGVELVGFVD